MRFLVTSVLTATLLTAGCAAQSPTYERKLADLREKLLILQNDRDRLEERLKALERRQNALVVAQGKSVAPRQERRPLKVLRLSPDDSSSPDDRPEPTQAVPTSGKRPVTTKTDERTLISGSGTNVTSSVSPGEKK